MSPSLLLMKKIISIFLYFLCLYRVEAQETISHRDVQYCGTHHQQQTLDLDVPSTGKNNPVVVFIHGGGWMEGDKNWYEDFVYYFAKRKFAAASINYRLYKNGKNRMGTQIQDVQCALQFLRRHAKKYRFNKKLFFLAGDSAGGHLALMVGLQDQRIKGIVTYAAPTDLVALYSANEDIKYYLAEALGGSLYKKRSLYEEYSPVNIIKEKSPPIMAFHGKKDELVPYEQVKLLEKNALEKKALLNRYTFTKEGHNFSPKAWQKIRLLTFKFLQNVVKATK